MCKRKPQIIAKEKATMLVKHQFPIYYTNGNNGLTNYIYIHFEAWWYPWWFNAWTAALNILGLMPDSAKIAKGKQHTTTFSQPAIINFCGILPSNYFQLYLYLWLCSFQPIMYEN